MRLNATPLALVLSLVFGGAAVAEGLPDLVVRRVEVRDATHVTAWVLNRGAADAPVCTARLSARDAKSEKELWSTRAAVPAVAAQQTVKIEFETRRAVTGTAIEVSVDATAALRESDERNNAARISGDEPAKPDAPAKPASPAQPAEPAQPALSPDLAAVSVTVEGKKVRGVVRNIDDRHYLAAGSGYAGSFSRTVTLQRVKTVNGKQIAENAGSFDIPHLDAGNSQAFAFPRPANDPNATRYRWVLTISGHDPNDANNTDAVTHDVTKID